MPVSSFTGQLTPFSGVESGWSSPGIGPKRSVFRASWRINLSLTPEKRENIDYFIATTDELVKKFGSLVRGPKQARQL